MMRIFWSRCNSTAPTGRKLSATPWPVVSIDTDRLAPSDAYLAESVYCTSKDDPAWKAGPMNEKKDGWYGRIAGARWPPALTLIGRFTPPWPASVVPALTLNGLKLSATKPSTTTVPPLRLNDPLRKI